MKSNDNDEPEKNNSRKQVSRISSTSSTHQLCSLLHQTSLLITFCECTVALYISSLSQMRTEGKDEDCRRQQQHRRPCRPIRAASSHRLHYEQRRYVVHSQGTTRQCFDASVNFLLCVLHRIETWRQFDVPASTLSQCVNRLTVSP